MKKIEQINLEIKLNYWHLIPFKTEHKDFKQLGFLCFELIITYKN